jgi:hypothetical protein
MSSGADTEVRPPAALYSGPVGVGLRMCLQRTAHAKVLPPGVGTPGRPVLCGGTGSLPWAQAAFRLSPWYTLTIKPTGCRVLP